jgi:hypothetical protein
MWPTRINGSSPSGLQLKVFFGPSGSNKKGTSLTHNKDMQGFVLEMLISTPIIKSKQAALCKESDGFMFTLIT